ncbi:hypothetical protein [Legionella fallonii]|uniref:Uncharacterized protein n=1 Tax=Legionella fallonii LLAP-10 TaxID=1212491 RepID=A0A098G3H4_9GAMM|nr:hypothetical protein [Legionella fallonii]CEG57018.1 conserved protein of unknown function [Legionella fallonii LLAP-10]
MNEKKTADEINQWFSTYGVITSERILGTYQIVLPQSELLAAVKSPFSFYHQLIQVPLKNVLNGIILQQANDYHVYAQKIFIDYLLSGESGKPPEAQGAHTRESIEEERKQLVIIGEEFHQKQTAHDSLIANSQSVLIKIAKEWKVIMESAIRLTSTTLKNNNLDIKRSVIRRAVTHALVFCDLTSPQIENDKYAFVNKMNQVLRLNLSEQLKEQIAHNLSDLINFTINFNSKISSFFERADELTQNALSYRTLFYEAILRVTELIKLLPEYKIDPIQDEANRESLHFDKTIGEKRTK